MTDEIIKNNDLKMFGKWDTNALVFKDSGVQQYMCVDPRIVPHTFGIKKKAIEKAKVNLVERLINKMMRSGQGKKKLSGKFIRHRMGCGKKEQLIKAVDEAFDYINKTTKENPLQVLVTAIENSAPREDIIKLQRGSITYTQAVDVAPMRRLDEALKNIALAAFKNTYNNSEDVYKALADELIAASKADQKSYAVKRRDEIERIAQGSR
ncbi:MAG: 30S ribosomal protein S7 [archaeon]